MAYGPGRYDPEYEEKGIDYPYPFVRWTEQRNMQAFLEFVEEGKVTPEKVVTHRFDFDDVLDSYKLLGSDSNEKYIGIILNYDTMKETDVFVEVASSDTVKSEKIMGGFIGAGNFAKGVLLPVVKKIDGIQLKALVTATGVSGRGSAEKYGFTRLFSDYKEILKDDSINTVFITTRHNLHYQMITDSLLAGKHDKDYFRCNGVD
jgi:hypothetical protein